MVDFVEEVEENLRAEQYANLGRRVLPWFIAALVATVAGWLAVWGYNSWQDGNVSKASQAYDKGLSALAGGDATGAFNDFAPIAKDGPPAYRTLALMQQANIRLAADKPAEAAALFDAAAKAAPGAILKDLAALRAAQTLMDTAPYAEIEARLKPLMGDKHPFALDAKEALAMAKLQAGKLQEARGDLSAIGLTLGVTPEMQQRDRAAIGLIDSGQAGQVGQVVRMAATLPPSSRAMVPGLFGGQQPQGAADGQDEGASAAEDSAQPPSRNAQ